MKKLTDNNAAKYTIVLIVITLLVRVLIAAYTGLGIGEAYYFRGALHLDFSYFDQPPLFFWLGAIGLKIFGLNNLGLRFPSVLMFAGTSWFLFLVTKKLFNARAGFWAVTVMNLSAVFTVAIACWYQPDAPLMFFWMLSTWLIAEVMHIGKDDLAVSSKGKIWLMWILIGISMGLATLSKYHVVFLFAGVFLFVAANKDQRHWLKHPGPYLAVLITLIMALPILYWNYKNNWVSFVFQGSRAGTGEGFHLHIDWFLRSMLGQAVWLLPWIWFPTVRQLFKSYKSQGLSQSYSFTFWLSVLPIIFFTVITLWADLQYHFHWQAPGYMMLFMPLGYAIDKSLNDFDTSSKRLTKRWLNFSIYFTIITITVLGFHMVTGFWQAYGPKWVVSLGGGKTDPTMQGVDYDDIGTRFEKEGWMNNKQIFAGSTRWWLNGKVDWALKGEKEMVCFNRDPRNIAFLVDPKTLLGEDAIVIGQDHQTDVENDVKPFFDEVKQLPDIAIIRYGTDEMHLQVYYCKHFKVPAKEMLDFPLYRQLIGKAPFGK